MARSTKFNESWLKIKDINGDIIGSYLQKIPNRGLQKRTFKLNDYLQ